MNLPFTIRTPFFVSHSNAEETLDKLSTLSGELYERINDLSQSIEELRKIDGVEEKAFFSSETLMMVSSKKTRINLSPEKPRATTESASALCRRFVIKMIFL